MSLIVETNRLSATVVFSNFDRLSVLVEIDAGQRVAEVAEVGIQRLIGRRIGFRRCDPGCRAGQDVDRAVGECAGAAAGQLGARQPEQRARAGIVTLAGTDGGGRELVAVSGEAGINSERRGAARDGVSAA